MIFAAEDKLSGVDHFEVKIDENDFQITQGNEFITDALSQGKHNLFILAEDKAGNHALKTDVLAIKSAWRIGVMNVIKILSAGILILILAFIAHKIIIRRKVLVKWFKKIQK